MTINYTKVTIGKTTYGINKRKNFMDTVFYYLEGGKVLSLPNGGNNGEWTLSGKRNGRPTMTCNLYAVFA